MEKAISEECQNVEYKETWHDEYLKWICGFANAQGGFLYIGINDNHEIIGINNSRKLMEDIPNKIVSQLGINCDVNLHQKNNREYIEIGVEPNSVPISFRGKYHYRSGSTKQELNGAALQQFVLKKMGRTWDDIIHDSATIDAIDRNAIDYFLKKGIIAKRVEKDELNADTQTILENLNLISEDGRLRNAALLLFSSKPGRYFPCTEFKIGKFGMDEADLITQDIVECNLIEMADKVMKTLKTYYLKSYIHYDGMQRIETFELPEAALREILYNAIAHRDYTGAPTQMHIYDDHIELWNDGTLPDGYTPEHLMHKHSSKPRNKNIAYTMFKAGFIESWGRGYKKIREGFEHYFQPVPMVEVVDGGVKISIKRQSAETIIANAKRIRRISEMRKACDPLADGLQQALKDLIINLSYQELTSTEIQLATTLATHVSRQFFNRQYMRPALDMKLIEMTFPDNPRHPNQKYRLTEKGLCLFEILKSKEAVSEK